MQRNITATTVLLACLVMGCKESTDPANPLPAASDLSTEILGTWETVELEIVFNSYMGQDTTITELIREADWGRVYGVRPPSTVFTSDGKLVRTNRMKTGGTVANVTNGIWKHRGDSLFVIEPNITYTYLHELAGDRLTLTGTVDQDQDGQRDDEFRAVYRLVARTN